MSPSPISPTVGFIRAPPEKGFKYNCLEVQGTTRHSTSGIENWLFNQICASR
jgi:hypothetical protein